MIAQLFKLQERRKNYTLALDAFAMLQDTLKLVYQISVQHNLFCSEPRKGFHFDFFWQILNDVFVGLQTPEDERTDDRTQAPISCCVVFQSLGKRLKL